MAVRVITPPEQNGLEPILLVSAVIVGTAFIVYVVALANAGVVVHPVPEYASVTLYCPVLGAPVVVMAGEVPLEPVVNVEIPGPVHV